ncbi:ferrochelatase, partial [Clostridium perfringens]
PVSFVGEHLETLIDLDMILQEQVAQLRPDVSFHRLPSPTIEEDWLAFLADLVLEAH